MTEVVKNTLPNSIDKEPVSLFDLNYSSLINEDDFHDCNDEYSVGYDPDCESNCDVVDTRTESYTGLSYDDNISLESIDTQYGIFGWSFIIKTNKNTITISNAHLTKINALTSICHNDFLYIVSGSVSGTIRVWKVDLLNGTYKMIQHKIVKFFFHPVKDISVNIDIQENIKVLEIIAYTSYDKDHLKVCYTFSLPI